MPIALPPARTAPAHEGGQRDPIIVGAHARTLRREVLLESRAMSAYDGFAPVYDTWASDMTEDVDFYVELAREAEGPVIELAVGTGRIAIPIAERTGKRVIGIDSSPAMLAGAREHASEAGVELDLREGDMRDLDLDEATDLVICPYRALLHLPTWADRRRVFERVARSARAGRSLRMERVRVRPSLRGRGRRNAGRRSRCGTTSSSRPATTGSTSRWRTGPSSRSGGSRDREWEGLLDVAGLETEALYGWFDRRPFDDDEPRVRLGRPQAG